MSKSYQKRAGETRGGVPLHMLWEEWEKRKIKVCGPLENFFWESEIETRQN